MNASVHQIYRTTTGPTKARTVSSDQPPLFRAWTDDGNFYGFLFHHLNSVLYSGQHACFCMDFVLGTLIIEGPKVLEFADDFAAQKVAVLKPDGIDITSVTLQKRPTKEEE
jgi:hypothetical protein